MASSLWAGLGIRLWIFQRLAESLQISGERDRDKHIKRWTEGRQRQADRGWKDRFPREFRPGGGAWTWGGAWPGAGLGAGPASVRPRTSSAVPVVSEAASRLLRGECGGRHAPPARPAPGFRWLHLRPVLAVHATAPRSDTGLRRGDWRQVCGGDVGSGLSKGARFEDGVWELETRVSRSGASGAGVCG